MCPCRVREVLGYGWVRMMSEVRDMTLPGSAEAVLAIGEHFRALISSLLTAELFLSRSVVEGASLGGCMRRTSPGQGGSTPGRRTASLGAYVWAPGFIVR